MVDPHPSFYLNRIKKKSLFIFEISRSQKIWPKELSQKIFSIINLGIYFGLIKNFNNIFGLLVQVLSINLNCVIDCAFYKEIN